jgi:hypothetical protein
VLVVGENRYARGPKRDILLVVDENRYVRRPNRIIHLPVVDEILYAAEVFLVL